MSEEHLTWRVHLLAENPARSVAVIAFLVLFCAVILLAAEWGFFILAIAFFLTTLASFFFPTHYELTPEGPSRRILMFRTRRKWEEFRNYFWGRDGVSLSTSATRSRIAPLQGFSIRFADNRDEVLAYLARHISRPAAVGPQGAAPREGRAGA